MDRGGFGGDHVFGIPLELFVVGVALVVFRALEDDCRDEEGFRNHVLEVLLVGVVFRALGDGGGQDEEGAQSRDEDVPLVGVVSVVLEALEDGWGVLHRSPNSQDEDGRWPEPPSPRVKLQLLSSFYYCLTKLFTNRN